MKLLSVKIDDELHKQLKIFAIQQEKTMAEIVIELVKKELETKKEQLSLATHVIAQELEVGYPYIYL